jgi:hypothetical protein
MGVGLPRLTVMTGNLKRGFRYPLSGAGELIAPLPIALRLIPDAYDRTLLLESVTTEEVSKVVLVIGIFFGAAICPLFLLLH